MPRKRTQQQLRLALGEARALAQPRRRVLPTERRVGRRGGLGGERRLHVRRTLDRWDRCELLWRTLEEMARDKPGTRDPDFVNRVDALTLWLNITDAIGRQTNALKVWIGNDELDITKGRLRADDNLFDDDDEDSTPKPADLGKITSLVEGDVYSLTSIMSVIDVRAVFCSPLPRRHLREPQPRLYRHPIRRSFPNPPVGPLVFAHRPVCAMVLVPFSR